MDDVWLQIKKARALYNQIIAVMREVYDEMQIFVRDRLPAESQERLQRIEQLNAAFTAARADNDEARMRDVAAQRRETWKTLSTDLKAVRAEYKAEMQERFYSRVGNNSRCATYQCRADAVRDGLGQATATAILNNALTAWKMSMARGRPPRFARGEERQQDSLTLQFAMAGGQPIEKFFTGQDQSLSIQYPKKGFRRKSYSQFRFRLGAASADCYATGTVQLHREIPAGSHVAKAFLVRSKRGRHWQYELQLMVTLPEPLNGAGTLRKKPLVAIHFGWAREDDGRNLAGISADGHPLHVQILQLPADVEEDLAESNQLQAMRDAYRDEIFPKLKTECADLPHDAESEDFLKRLWAKYRRLPVQHVSADQLQRFVSALRMREEYPLPNWLVRWYKVDKRLGDRAKALARKARNRRMYFYRQVALGLARNYESILVDMPELKKAAEIVDPVTGERTDMTRKARSGRVVASLYSLESAIKWAACKEGTAVLELGSEETVQDCAFCGAHGLQSDAENGQELYCPECGSRASRKATGAANSWRIANARREELVTDYWYQTLELRQKKMVAKQEKNAKMAEGRRKFRATRLRELTALAG
ncbi:hypothetical protein ACJU26_09835 [Acidithiobacillus sp. M4-SHS-6]|uniref:hypothetical protein n=1 Tax=Acidithiobacillus sp. M4-SHS-6 TaxID=3383024 RepID=UPI0039BEA9CC